MTLFRVVQLIILGSGLMFGWTVHARTEVTGNYHIKLDSKLSHLQVHACFPQSRPVALRAGSVLAVKYLDNASMVVNGKSMPLPVNRRSIELQNLPADGCLDYTVSFSHYRRSGRDDRMEVAMPDTIKTDAGDWLWLPVEQTGPMQLYFDLPKGVEIAAPWHLTDVSKSENSYVIDPNDSAVYSDVYFGGFSKRDITVPGARIRIAIMGDISSRTRNKLTNWVRYGAESVVALYGRYPLPNPLVIVFPIGPYESAVPWGEVKRNGGSCAILYVDHTRPLQELIADWTLIHELSHMSHPYLDYSGRWITEGLATYYQNVLQARVGTLTARQAWTKLHEGFQRGISETRAGEKLIDVSRNMRSNRLYMRVYWSGVALALKADWLLRKNNSSLDGILSRFQRCCLPENRNWTPTTFMQKLDELSATHIFTDLYNEYAYSDRFPDLGDVYAALGLQEINDSLHMLQTTVDINIRNDIMRPDRTGFSKQDPANPVSDRENHKINSIIFSL